MIRRPPSSTLFPSTTLFRSATSRSIRVRESSPDPPGDSALRFHSQSLFRTSPVDGSSLRQPAVDYVISRSEEHTSELQSRQYLVCRLLLEKKTKHQFTTH